jgi:hypothetical protein
VRSAASSVKPQTALVLNVPRPLIQGGKSKRVSTMCNLYSITTNQAAIINLFRVINR